MEFPVLHACLLPALHDGLVFQVSPQTRIPYNSTFFQVTGLVSVLRGRFPYLYMPAIIDYYGF